VWVIDLLAIQPHDHVLEVGFGPGVSVALLAQAASAGSVAGVGASTEMVAQATARNAQAMKSGRVDVRHGTVECLPFADETFDKALAINSMQVWTDVEQGCEKCGGF
jgi:ubiquinone/menaquinone biosynthesis C-methylase UbiE